MVEQLTALRAKTRLSAAGAHPLSRRVADARNILVRGLTHRKGTIGASREATETALTEAKAAGRKLVSRGIGHGPGAIQTSGRGMTSAPARGIGGIQPKSQSPSPEAIAPAPSNLQPASFNPAAQGQVELGREPVRQVANQTCHKLDVQLPCGASDELWDPQRLAQAYDRQCFSGIRDLVVIVTLRFPEVDEGRMQLHEAWTLSQGFADQLVSDHGVAVVSAMHVPARAAKPGLPHVHLMIPARQLLPSGFGKFARPLATDEGRALVESAWVAWREASDAAN